MAKLLESEVKKIPQIRLTQKVEANGVFAIVTPQIIEPLRQKFFFYMWNEAASEVRWMTSFDTTEQEILDFAKLIRELLK
jgi:threonine aldolase